MTLSEIRHRIRSKLDDEVGSDSTRYWSDEFLNEHINAAIEKVAIASQCIVDSLTDSVCLISLVPNQRHYQLHDSILDVKMAQPSWRNNPLSQETVATITPGWLKNTGLPSSFLLDYSRGKLSLTSAPETVTTESIRLTVSRLPLAELRDNATPVPPAPVVVTDVPEIDRQYHRMLFDDVIAAAFSKLDSEVYNPSKAKTHQTAFEDSLEEIVKREARLKPRISVARRVEMS